jgi:glycine/D-amino acid oxidase-like deaminating enzyme
VRAPVTPHYREAPQWHDAAAGVRPPLPPHALPPEVDAVVVGGGYCGLSAAATLASLGRSTVVAEAGAIEHGASSRNGGMVIPELKAGPAALEGRYGDDGRLMYAAVNEAFDDIERIAAESVIDVEYRRSGQLYLAHHPRLVPKLAETAREHAARGEPVRFVPRDELATEIGSAAYHAAVLFERTGGIQPALLHAELLRRALAAGADVHDRTRVTAIERRGGAFDVHTERGTVRARDVMLATNAYADGVVPALARRVVPVGSFIISTEVLDEPARRAVSPRGRMMVDTKQFLFYWRLTPDGRMMFGGRRSLAPVGVPEARDFLYRSMLRIHPQLAGVRVEAAWGGNVALTLDRLPHAGRFSGIWYATGCNGSGVALNTWLGRAVAGAICGGEPPVFARLAFPAVPLHRARRVALPIAGTWFGLRDRLGI